MSMGYLRLSVKAGDHTIPVGNARVQIFGNNGRQLYETKTDNNGLTQDFSIMAPEKIQKLEQDHQNPASFITTPNQITMSKSAPPLSEYFNYTVVAGDSLWEIAQRFGTTVKDIKAINGLVSDVIMVDQVLKIPNESTSLPYFKYTVKNGDTLWTLANKFNTEADKIMMLNGLGSIALYVGQVLKIPQEENTPRKFELPAEANDEELNTQTEKEIITSNQIGPSTGTNTEEPGTQMEEETTIPAQSNIDWRKNFSKCGYKPIK